MQKKMFWLTLILASLIVLITACGSSTPTSTTISASPAIPSNENLYVLDGYATSTFSNVEQQIVAFRPSVVPSTALVTLPAGLVSQDHQKIYTASAQNDRTTITVTNTLTGARIHSFVIPGNYTTAGQYYSKAVISANGRWLALDNPSPIGTLSTIVLVDTQAGKLVKTIQLKGDFDLDAISPDSSRLYLLEQLNDKAGHYNVRLYQVDQNQLLPYPIIDKQETDTSMVGSALTRQMSSDGTIAYTLYTNTNTNTAFVHILPLAGDYIGARCIELLVGKSTDLLHYYTLTLSTDGTTLYAANGALGIISTINVQSAQVFDDHIGKTIHFDIGKANMTNGDKVRILYKGAMLSPDQKTLYFVGIHGIWATDTANLTIKNNYATQQIFTGIALSTNEQTLYAIYPASGLTIVDVGSGQSQRISLNTVRSPWGIEWISH